MSAIGAPTNYPPFHSWQEIGSLSLAITAVALTILGALSYFQIGALGPISAHWYGFGIGAVATLGGSVTLFLLRPAPSPLPPAPVPTNEIDSLVQLAHMIMPHNPSDAIAIYSDAARAGSGEAAFQLALCYENGVGVTKDPQRAHGYLLVAHTRKSVKATYTFALRHFDKQDRKNGFKLAIKAANIENSHFKQVLEKVLSLPSPSDDPLLAENTAIRAVRTHLQQLQASRQS